MLYFTTINHFMEIKQGIEQVRALIKNKFERNTLGPIARHNYWLSKSHLSSNLATVLEEIIQNQKEHKHYRELHLYLMDNKIGQKHIAKALKVNFPKLTHIILNSNNLGDAGCMRLAKARWPLLNSIGLCSNRITEKGCFYLSRADWSRLREMGIYYNYIQKSGYKALKSSFRHCNIMCNESYKRQ